MEVLAALLVVATLAAVVWVVGAPLRRGPASPEDPRQERRRELEAAREAKIREIREGELDRRTGKLSEEDFRAQDRELRGQAVVILRELDELEDAPGAS